ncbi:MAG: LysM peptidoglycan-binding domain-containing protein [Candidatus Omnitrophica bacterium]|nr:LysM peptidoglycan-binding domain-containing protein [Candidatus Omnitrophota bacterium]
MRGFFIINKKHSAYRCISNLFVCLLTVSLVFSPVAGYAQSINLLNLPIPGTMVGLSPVFNPAIVAGIKIYPENPLQFDFIIDIGDDQLQGEALRQESQKLINYFMATLTVPEDEMWVNLSPYEKDRIIAEGLSHTEMGRDMLAQDYLLKQLTASLMYPEDDFGKEFWNRVYSKAQAEYGTTEIPMNTFNKIWIVPDEAVVYVHDTNVFVVKNHLKVMLEEDYLALESNVRSAKHGLGNVTKDDIEIISGVSAEIVREVLLPEIEKEVNQGKNFANLRQMYNSMLLATWYKKNLKESLLAKIYADKNKVNGIELEDKEIKQKIYDRYVEAFEKGVYNYIKEDIDSVTQEVIPRKYFSGGITNFENGFKKMEGVVSSAVENKLTEKQYAVVAMKVETSGNDEESSSPVSNTHIVEDENETLQTIAREYGMTEELILKLNPGRGISDFLRSGNEIKIDPKSLKKQREAFQTAINESGEIELGFILRIITEQDTPTISTQEQLFLDLFQRSLAHYPVPTVGLGWFRDKGYDYGTHGNVPLLKRKLIRVGAEKMIEERIEKIAEKSSSPLTNLEKGLDNLERINRLNEYYSVIVGEKSLLEMKEDEVISLQKEATRLFEKAIRQNEKGARKNVDALWSVVEQFENETDISQLYEQAEVLVDVIKTNRGHLAQGQHEITPAKLDSYMPRAIKIMTEIIEKKKPELLASSPISDNAMLLNLVPDAARVLGVEWESKPNPFGEDNDHYRSKAHVAGIILKYLNIPELKEFERGAKWKIERMLELGSSYNLDVRAIAAGIALDHPEIFERKVQEDAARVLGVKWESKPNPFGENNDHYRSKAHVAGIILKHLNIPELKEFERDTKWKIERMLELGSSYNLDVRAIAAGIALDHPEIFERKVQEDAVRVLGVKWKSESNSFDHYRSKAHVAGIILKHLNIPELKELERSAKWRIERMVELGSSYDFDVKAIAAGVILNTVSSPVQASPEYGGIDFNPNNINLNEQGDKMRINFSAAGLQNLNPESINGILPVIINISPLPSILPLLGLAPQREEEGFEVSSLN